MEEEPKTMTSMDAFKQYGWLIGVVVVLLLVIVGLILLYRFRKSRQVRAAAEKAKEAVSSIKDKVGNLKKRRRAGGDDEETAGGAPTYHGGIQIQGHMYKEGEECTTGGDGQHPIMRSIIHEISSVNH